MKLTTRKKAIQTIAKRARKENIPFDRPNSNTLNFHTMTDTLRSYIRGVLQAGYETGIVHEEVLQYRFYAQERWSEWKTVPTVEAKGEFNEGEYPEGEL